MRAIIVCLVLLITTGGFVTSEPAPTDDDSFKIAEFEDRLDNYITSGLQCHNNPALAIAVIRKGRTVLAKGYGRVKKDSSAETVSNSTLFGIASCTKAFAATLILMLIEDHPSVSLTTKVKDILGDDVFGDNLRAHYTTLEDLLSHRVGIPSNNKIRLDDTLNRTNLAGRIKYLKAVGGFRTSFMYNNLMYGLITRIAELLGNDTWENLVRDRIFIPLGMTSSTFVTTADPQTLALARGYQDVDGQLHEVSFDFSRRWGELCGSGCILSNVVDMAKWLQFNLNEGRTENGTRLLSASIHSALFKPENIARSSNTYYSRPTMPESWNNAFYGLGWKIGFYRGLPFISHTGSTYGYRAIATLMPSADTGVFIAMTGDDPSYIFRSNIQLFVHDLLLNETPWLDNQTICTFPAPWKKRKSKTPSKPHFDVPMTRPLADFEGVYFNDAYGRITISATASSKLLQLKYGVYVFTLYRQSVEDENIFYGQGNDDIRFLMNIGELNFEFNGSHASSFVVPSYAKRYPPRFRRIEPKSAFVTDALHAGTSGMSTLVMMYTYCVISLITSYIVG